MHQQAHTFERVLFHDLWPRNRMQYCSVVDSIEGSDTICCCTIDADVDVDAGLMFFFLFSKANNKHIQQLCLLCVLLTQYDLTGRWCVVRCWSMRSCENPSNAVWLDKRWLWNREHTLTHTYTANVCDKAFQFNVTIT